MLAGMLRIILALLLTVLILYVLSMLSVERWVVYYANALPPNAFKPFDVIVFDSDSHPPLAALKEQHKLLLGYISLGEAEDYRDYYKDIESQHLLLEANPAWKGHRIIDVRKPEWTAYAINVLVPKVLAQGFDGIMIDTMDSVTHLEDEDPKQYAGMKQAAAQLIKAIRAHYPYIKIMVNRGFDLLPYVGEDIDMVMAESTYSLWSPGKTPSLVNDADRKHYIEMLHA